MVASLLAVNNPFPFSISGFTGLTTTQIVSFFAAFVVFNIYVVLIAAALVALYVTAKPRHGRVRTAALWHFAATILMTLAFISLVWGSPAENMFFNDIPINTNFSWLFHTRHDAIYSGAALFVLPALLCMMAGFSRGARQKRVLREEALAAV